MFSSGPVNLRQTYNPFSVLNMRGCSQKSRVRSVGMRWALIVSIACQRVTDQLISQDWCQQFSFWRRHPVFGFGGGAGSTLYVIRSAQDSKHKSLVRVRMSLSSGREQNSRRIPVRVRARLDCASDDPAHGKLSGRDHGHPGVGHERLRNRRARACPRPYCHRDRRTPDRQSWARHRRDRGDPASRKRLICCALLAPPQRSGSAPTRSADGSNDDQGCFFALDH